ncbi:MAG TPA: hypothetical protein VEC11_04465 [Allosphingosinicella sp.]|nr:hypothetical protein [Allosphingosinicella sp.]
MFAAFMLILAGVSQPAAGVRLPQGSHFYHAPPVAVDHEAVVVSHRISGSDTSAGQNERRHWIVRSGSWIRESGSADARSGFAYSDFATGISIAYSRDADGYQSLTRPACTSGCSARIARSGARPGFRRSRVRISSC